jgi:serine/threonine protein kinase
VVKMRRFGNYEIIRKLGRSMTDVYLALDPSKNLRVVLKLIEQSRDRTTQILIEAERRGAQIQKQLRDVDPRILQVYEIGEQSGCFYVAMEHFEGSSVAQLLEAERRLDPARAATYALEVLSQLQTLHSFLADVDGRRRAVVHGDIKPSNIQVGANGSVRLLDFGIAKMITFTHNLTRHNLGSPTYCSPERLANAQVDPQADLWALGVSLYEMVSGMPPYQAVTTRKLEALIQSRRPPRALPENCPPRLRAILFKALAADHQRRYASAADFASDLRAFLDNRHTVATEEKLPAWDANATIQRSPSDSIRRLAVKIPKPRQATIARIARPVCAGLLFGLLVVMPLTLFYKFRDESRPLRESSPQTTRSAAQIEADWNLYKRIERENSFLGRLSPAPGLAPALHVNLLAAANAVIDAYRNGSDPALTDFDWSKARLTLSYALQLDPSDTETRGKLALCDGYLNLIEHPKLPDAQRSETEFQMAAADLPRSPDPHLGLARFYIYVFRNAGLALGQFTEVERRGFRLGPRELEQEADGYLYRAEFELRQAGRAVSVSNDEEDRWLHQSWDDLERARNLYEPLAGFSKVSAGLDQLYADRSHQQQLRAELVEAQAEAEAAAQAALRQKPKPKRPIHRKIVASMSYGDH